MKATWHDEGAGGNDNTKQSRRGMRLFMSRLFCYYMMWGKPCFGLPANDGWAVESLRLGGGG